jgi:hypothetical protein
MWDVKSQCGDMQKEEIVDHGDNHKGNTIKSKTIEIFFIYMSHLWFEWT